MEPPPGDSLQLVKTRVREGANPRAVYLAAPVDATPPPIVCASPFVHRPMVEHLMHNKRPVAIGAKYKPWTKITNMEACLHTFVIPVVPIAIHGDYRWAGYHGVARLPAADPQYARNVVLSALIHPDFENDEVFMQLVALRAGPSVGRPLPLDTPIPSSMEKYDDATRHAYDERIRLHVVYHLVPQHVLPSASEAAPSALDVGSTKTFLESCIPTHFTNIAAAMRGKTMRLEPRIISLEMLFYTYVGITRNELFALEQSCSQGYVYTFDPPSIFAQMIEASVLNRILVVALKYVTQMHPLRNMRVYAFNDYADAGMIPLLKAALHSTVPDVVVMPKAHLFRGPGGMYSGAGEAARGALLVLHNNSDGFGQNIETESGGGSMDAVIGMYSSAAASLRRDRPDLLMHVLYPDSEG